ncbi:Abscisic acid 8'-hydroxylase [Arachis hypogaea]|nr:Abscisic acid 8'-hydroxylase [Arachis hypogaea]
MPLQSSQLPLMRSAFSLLVYLLLFFSKLLIKQSRNQINVIRRKRNSAKKFLKRDTIDLLANHLQVHSIFCSSNALWIPCHNKEGINLASFLSENKANSYASLYSANLMRDASLNDRVELRILGDVGAKIRVMNFDTPDVHFRERWRENESGGGRRERGTVVNLSAWQLPPSNIFSVNRDASFRDRNNFGGFGCLILDNLANWLLGCSDPIPENNILRFHERILRIYDDFVWPLNLSSLASENKFLAVKLKQAANGIFLESNASSVNDYEVIQKTLRSASILSFTFREVVEDVELQDYYIPKGWKVLPLFKAFTILLISSLNHTNSTTHASRWQNFGGRYFEFGELERRYTGRNKIIILCYFSYFQGIS